MRCVISDAIEKVFVSFFYYFGYRRFVSRVQVLPTAATQKTRAAQRFCLPDLASSHWVHSLCLGYFVCVRLFSCIISACMLIYCNTVRWAWLNWGLSEWLTTLLQCFDTVGWVIRPVKTVGHNVLYVLCLSVCLFLFTYYGPCLPEINSLMTMITYIVLSQTLNPHQSINQRQRWASKG